MIGAIAFAAIGLAVVALVPDAGAVPAVALGLFMPLAFISDMLADIGGIFPLKHLMHAVDGAFARGTITIDHLGVVVLWGALGAFIAVNRFRWTPR